MNVVIDTNVLLRMAANPTDSLLFIAWLKSRFYLILSAEMLHELQSVFSRPKIQRFVRPHRAREFLRNLEAQAIFVVPAQEYPRCRDPKDDMVVATAVAAQANYLITTDKDLTDDPQLVAALAQLAIQVITPVQFLANL